MSVSKRAATVSVIASAIVVAGFLSFIPTQLTAESPAAAEGASQTTPDNGRPSPVCEPSALDSPYIPVDSWVYTDVFRLYGLGYIDTVFLNMRPWTRASLDHMLEQAGARLEDMQDTPDPTLNEAQEIYEALDRELHPDMQGPCHTFKGNARIESIYSTSLGITGAPLHDSNHLGQTVINNYGRPYQNGFNNYTGISGYASAGRFLVYARGEFQATPSTKGYSTALAQQLSELDGIKFIDPNTGQPYHQMTIPLGPIDATIRARVLEAYFSANVLHHEFSFGKQDYWLGPGLGAGFAYSNNAENLYSFRINRVEPLHIPGLSYVTGPFRYEFMIGGLHGHTYVPNPAYPGAGQPNVINPGGPWMHLEKISFRPTENLEFGFQRTVIWGGQGHGPITIHSFLRSFFSVSSPSAGVKLGRDDPGARFGAFDFSYRLPFVRKWFTLYTDGEVHDDVSPIDAPRRAAWRPGLYLSHVPGLPKVDVRVEAVYTDPPVSTSKSGRFMYWETIQRQGYTNNGQIFGDWLGREAKGGQGWIAYHLSGNEWIQIGMRNQKVAKDFIRGGTTINDMNFQIVKRIGKDFEINSNFALEQWKVPIYLQGQQTVTCTAIQLTLVSPT